MRFAEFAKEYKKTFLNNLTLIYDGTHQTPNYKVSGVPFVSVEDISNLNETTKYISYEDFRNNFKTYPKYGDVLMTRIGSIGVPTIIADNIQRGYYVSLALLRPKGNLDSNYLKFIIESPRFQHELWKRTIHVAFPKKINKDDIGKCSLYYCDIEEQNKIAKILNKIDERIYTQIKIIEDYTVLKNKINNKLYYTLNCNEVEFSSIYHIAKEGGTPSTSKPEYFLGNIPFIKIDDLASKYITSNKTFISNEGLSNSSAWIVPKNSIIMSNGGTIGNVSINIYPVSTKQGILGIVPKDHVLTEYLFYLLNSTSIKKAIKKITTKGTIECAYIKDIDKIKVKIPQISIQNNFIHILSLYDKIIELEKGMLEQLKKQKEFMLKNLFV